MPPRMTPKKNPPENLGGQIPGGGCKKTPPADFPDFPEIDHFSTIFCPIFRIFADLRKIANFPEIGPPTASGALPGGQPPRRAPASPAEPRPRPPSASSLRSGPRPDSPPKNFPGLAPPRTSPGSAAAPGSASGSRGSALRQKFSRLLLLRQKISRLLQKISAVPDQPPPKNIFSGSATENPGLAGARLTAQTAETDFGPRRCAPSADHWREDGLGYSVIGKIERGLLGPSP